MNKDQKIGKATGKLKNFIIEPFVPHKPVRLCALFAFLLFLFSFSFFFFSLSRTHEKKKRSLGAFVREPECSRSPRKLHILAQSKKMKVVCFNFLIPERRSLRLHLLAQNGRHDFVLSRRWGGHWRR